MHTSIDITEQQRLDAERSLVAAANRDEMIKLMGEHGILIPARRLAWWRPTIRTSGDIDGVHEALTIIATDGLLGWFLTFEGEAWCGHVQCFSGEIKPLYSFTSGSGKKSKSRVRQKSKRQQIIDSM